ncbi:cytochrome c biogenesis protein ResB [Kineococcus sp. TBRC 1896]|uniref:Cytochrome c biogenesis protein ResB n=1 Tax=Kineococcus mangrovi TaxID=1660183 RepID=A0ABV4I206_9ACTN
MARTDETHLDDLRDAYRDAGQGTERPPKPKRELASEMTPLEFARFCWRQLTSMRTALFLLMLLAVAAVPGSTFPQENNDPSGVATFLRDHPTAGPWVERLQGFHVYSSVWFSAIYLLLFISLIGCVLPRVGVHWRSLRSKPPRTPARLDRLPEHRETTLGAPPQEVLDAARAVLAKRHFRAERREGSVAAEKGHHRESGNLLFHLSLVGLLVAIASSSLFSYAGQRIVTTGSTMVGTQLDSFSGGTWTTIDDVPPFTLGLDAMDVAFEAQQSSQRGEPRRFAASVTLTDSPGDEPRRETIRVNHPGKVGHTQISLSGNGYAPVVVVRDGQGNVVQDGATPFLPQTSNYDSTGVVKVPDAVAADGAPVQLGVQGVFLPTASTNAAGQPVSVFPDAVNPLLVARVWTGDLGLDDGVAQNVYTLDTSGMSEVAGADGQPLALTMRPGQTVQLPNGLGSVEFAGVERFASFDVRYTPGQTAALVFALLATTGLILSLFLPRRRVWVKAAAGAGGTSVQVGGLARGNDAGLAEEVEGVLRRLREALGEPAPEPAPDPGGSPPPPAVGDDEQPVHVPEERP